MLQRSVAPRSKRIPISPKSKRWPASTNDPWWQPPQRLGEHVPRLDPGGLAATGSLPKWPWLEFCLRSQDRLLWFVESLHGPALPQAPRGRRQGHLEDEARSPKSSAPTQSRLNPPRSRLRQNSVLRIGGRL